MTLSLCYELSRLEANRSLVLESWVAGHLLRQPGGSSSLLMKGWQELGCIPTITELFRPVYAADRGLILFGFINSLWLMCFIVDIIWREI
jgi:hypothetical protein